MSQLFAPLQLRYFFSRYFKDKSVAIVGSSGSLLNSEHGSAIDAHDIVIRFNLMNPEGQERAMGQRTDIRFIGCTLLNKHIPFIQGLETNSIIVSTLKNYTYKDMLSSKCYFYEKKLPRKAFRYIQSQVNNALPGCETLKPPRTGIVCLSMLMKFSSPANISLYGVSRTAEESTSRIDYSNGLVQKYDINHLKMNHCDVALEVEVLKSLAQQRVISVN